MEATSKSRLLNACESVRQTLLLPLRHFGCPYLPQGEPPHQMLSLLRTYAMRVPPLRWLMVLAVSTLALLRALPAHFAKVNKAFTPYRSLPLADQKRIAQASFKRFRRGLLRVVNHRRMVLGELRGE